MHTQDISALAAREERDAQLDLMKAALGRPLALTAADVVCKSVHSALMSRPSEQLLAAIAKAASKPPASASVVPSHALSPATRRQLEKDYLAKIIEPSPHNLTGSARCTPARRNS